MDSSNEFISQVEATAAVRLVANKGDASTDVKFGNAYVAFLYDFSLLHKCRFSLFMYLVVRINSVECWIYIFYDRTHLTLFHSVSFVELMLIWFSLGLFAICMPT